MTHESLRLATEFSSILTILLAAALLSTIVFFISVNLSQSQFNFIFSFNSYNSYLSFVLITRYIFIVSKIILTLYKYNRTYFVIYVIAEYFLIILEEAYSINYFRDNRHGDLLIW